MNIIFCVCGFSLGCLGWSGRLDLKPKKDIKAIYCCEGKSGHVPLQFLLWILLLTDLHICYT